MRINKIKGTIDFFGYEVEKYRYIEKICVDIAKKFGYSEVITPIFESTDVFVRSVGESSDIVNKEMYTFTDRGNRSLTLRPEGTAPMMRMFIENKLYVNPGLAKYYYFGPIFRYERPQKGRYHQFTQFGVETYGLENPLLDADVINLACKIMNALGIENVKVCLNTLGSKEARNAYVPALKEYFAPHLEEMCPDCKVRFEKNPLRMLDCKADANTEIMNNVPRISDYLTEEDKAYFEDLKNALDALGIKYEVSDKLVRGLDYYSNDVFELIYDNPESAINGLTLCAGGRYNDMGRDFDGPDVKAIGFAFGVERLMMALDELGIKVPNTSKDKVTVITLGKPVKQVGLKLVDYLRTNGIHAEIDYQSDNLKPQFKLAERIKARYIIIIGEDEVANNIMTIKDTVEQKEVKIKVDELNNYFNIKGDKNYAY